MTAIQELIRQLKGAIQLIDDHGVLNDYAQCRKEVYESVLDNAVSLAASQHIQGEWVEAWVEKDAVKEQPGKDVNEIFICIIEQRANGKVSHKPAYCHWRYSIWDCEDGWKVISWLSPTTVQGYSESHPSAVQAEALREDEQIGESIMADFEESTWTFRMNQDFTMTAGKYKIIPLTANT